jgi:hypothetical protein
MEKEKYFEAELEIIMMESQGDVICLSNGGGTGGDDPTVPSTDW